MRLAQPATARSLGQGPVVDARGTVFAAAFSGAIDGYGDVFRVGPTGTHTTLYKLQSLATDGHCPASGVIRSRSGMLFGTTLGNGYGGDPTGTVWQLSPSGALKTLYVFQTGRTANIPISRRCWTGRAISTAPPPPAAPATSPVRSGSSTPPARLRCSMSSTPQRTAPAP